jgi:NDP-sugar pyrophosphorylase family protein
MEKKESKIRRSSYVRKSYTRKDGTKVKGSKVKSSLIKDQGKIGKGRKLFEIKDKGLLTRNGYSLKKNSKERKTSLRRASKEIGMLPVLRHINAIRTLQKNNPDNFKKLDQDVKFVQKEYKMKNKNK